MTHIYLDDETEKILNAFRKLDSNFNLSFFIRQILLDYKGFKNCPLNKRYVEERLEEERLALLKAQNNITRWEEVLATIRCKETQEQEAVECLEKEKERRKVNEEEVKKGIIEVFESDTGIKMTDEMYQHYKDSKLSLFAYEDKFYSKELKAMEVTNNTN